MDENKNTSNGAQNIDGVLEELRRSYSADAQNLKADVTEQTATDFSHDELQERLREQFLHGDAHATDGSDEDNYAIDEEFLSDAYEEAENESEKDEAEEIDFFDDGDEKIPEEIEENEYEFYDGSGEGYPQIEDEKAYEEEIEALEEASDYEGSEAFQEEDLEGYQEDEEISLYEGLEKIQEEADSETLEEIYASQEDQEIQEEVNTDVQIDSDEFYFDEDLFFDGEDSEFMQELEDEAYGSSVAVATDVEDADDVDEPVLEETAQKTAEDNYINVFYRSNDEGPFGNRSFKEIIAETTMSVDSLEAALNSDESDSDFETESFDEVKSVPLIIEEDSDPANRELDRADLALLLEFGYRDDLLKTVSSESIEKLSDEEFENNVEEEVVVEEIEVEAEEKSESKTDKEMTEKTFARDNAESRKAKTKERINSQYLEYRKKRGGALLELLISSALAVVLMLYELLPILGVDFPSFIRRENNIALYVFFGVLLTFVALLPASKHIIESFKNFFVSGIDAYIMAGTAACVTVLYDFIIIFAAPDNTPVPTFHLCVVIVLVLAELSAFLHSMAEIKNYEYYFSEFIFGTEDEDDVTTHKYTLQKSEGKSSVAEKMYAGGVSPQKVICAPQNVDSATGFFEANKTKSTRNRSAFSLLIVSAVLAFVFTIISAIVSSSFWVAMVAFMATFGFSLPIAAIIAERLPFEMLSANNYSYGAAFASEASLEKIAECDMFVFYDSHLFEKCDTKSVNLAIYDSTPKSVLLSCLNSVYSEIGGPLQATFASLKTQSYGECKVKRVARNGVEAVVGSNYSVIIGDEQFMSRYGITFPTASLGKEEDKIYTLCVSINSRPTARIAVKYKLNEVFLNLVQKIAEDDILCVVETYDPMISTALISRLRTQTGFQINIVHKNAADLAIEKHRAGKEGALFSAAGKGLPLLARGSRLNLAVATSNAKKLKNLRFILNMLSYASVFVGVLISLVLILGDKIKTFSGLELVIVLYWIASGAAFAGFMAWKFPRRDRFVFSRKGKD